MSAPAPDLMPDKGRFLRLQGKFALYCIYILRLSLNYGKPLDKWEIIANTALILKV